MRFLKIDPLKRSVEELELKLEANTFYTYFGSILIDELPIGNNHTLYSDANALSQNKPAYFVGEQLVVGEALILGRNGMQEVDATASCHDIEQIVLFDVSDFYKDALKLLAKSDVNLYRAFGVEHNGMKMDLNIAWVLYFFNIADEKTKAYFLEHLQAAVCDSKMVEKFMIKMAQAALKVAG